jgi:hypothetical protein
MLVAYQCAQLTGQIEPHLKTVVYGMGQLESEV